MVAIQYGTPLYRLYRKLKATELKIRSVNKDLYGDLTWRVDLARLRLESCQAELLKNNSNGRISNLEQLLSLSKVEEAFLKQKSRN